jgi:hypothetical protein
VCVGRDSSQTLISSGGTIQIYSDRVAAHERSTGLTRDHTGHDSLGIHVPEIVDLKEFLDIVTIHRMVGHETAMLVLLSLQIAEVAVDGCTDGHGIVLVLAQETGPLVVAEERDQVGVGIGRSTANRSTGVPQTLNGGAARLGEITSSAAIVANRYLSTDLPSVSTAPTLSTTVSPSEVWRTGRSAQRVRPC